MPVIVNDLEVVTETQAAPQATAPSGEAAAPEASAAAPAQALGPEEVAELLRHAAERAARLCDC
ncbi:MAG TPA: hypothetical protein VLU43_01125 [Anaeromyxobacteraceae bacterium]|nr:hypothetical protein [Anaeromyxobacteraceae bacterium]